MHVENYAHFGGAHTESSIMANTLKHAGVNDPRTGKPLTEAMCFGIAGGIGAGYGFCPSVPRHGTGSGVTIVGRHKCYATDATWYKEFYDRIGAKSRVTETAAKGKAYQNLVTELEAGRPTIVWSGHSAQSHFGAPCTAMNCYMHTFLVYAVDETKKQAQCVERAPTKITISLDELAAARSAVCSHKNRTLTFDPPKSLTAARVKAATLEGLRACIGELLRPRMKTFSLEGLDIWAKMINNSTNKNGWRKAFKEHMMYNALRDTFDSIETCGSGGGLYRRTFATFLDEAAVVTGKKALAASATEYRGLSDQWTELADATLPSGIKLFKQTKDTLRKKERLFVEKGEKAGASFAAAIEKLSLLESAADVEFPLDEDETADLLETLQGRILTLYQAETAAARRLQKAV